MVPPPCERNSAAPGGIDDHSVLLFAKTTTPEPLNSLKAAELTA
jgi:hypothetical protein